VNRRKFLSLLGLAPVDIAAAPLLEKLIPVPVVPAATGYRTYIQGAQAVLHPPLTVEMIREAKRQLTDVNILPSNAKVVCYLPPETHFRFRYITTEESIA